jgi:SAM-dependent methyltransferase
MAVAHPDADIRGWLARNSDAADPYTRLRIEESFDHVDAILAPLEDARRGSVLDVGCGTAFNDFAFASHFDRVTGIDASRRRISASRKLAGQAGVSRIHFERGRGEDYSAGEPFDFVYCNIMSDLTSSRRGLVERLAAAAAKDAPIFYAESCEGYAPGEMTGAIERRDGPELRMRLRQVINGFCGRPAFRFFLTGSAERVFAQHGYDVVKVERKGHGGLTSVESVWLRPRSTPSPAGGEDRDYATVEPELADMRATFQACVESRGPEERELLARAAGDSNRLAPFLALLAMALEVPGARPSEAGWVRARARDKAPSRLRPRDPDWGRAAELLQRFESLVRERAGDGHLLLAQPA